MRGADFLTGGFRGWSGSARNSFFIAPDAATPGYLRGPIQPGEWNIMLGCLADRGRAACRYRVNIELDIDPAAVDEPAGEPRVPGMPRVEVVAGRIERRRREVVPGRPARAQRAQRRRRTPSRRSSNYTRGVGLEYFALTDHNTISHWDELARLNDRAPLLIPGEEMTMYGGHANVWGLDGWLDFRGSERRGASSGWWSRRTRADRCSRSTTRTRRSRGSTTASRGYQAIEVWNAPWRWFNEPALQRWEGHLQRGERMVAVGGSDSHCVPPATMTQPNGPGEPCTWVYVEGPLTQRAVLEAVIAGHVFISEAPNGPFIELPGGH